ncbi:MAG: YihY/virulence factor BrkB family protein [Acidobacteriota bacterium]|nr:YihY/virulence factor BrkB family protein [Acidobacteriota bacterium]
MRVRTLPPYFSLDFALSCFPAALRNFYWNDALTYAGALAFFFLLALFPLLIFLATALAYSPAPHLFQEVVNAMSLIVPAEAMGRVELVLGEVLRKDAGLLSFGILASIWIASVGFEAMINVLNRVFEVRKTRPYWKRRLLSLGLTVLVGGMVIVAVVAGLAGPLVRSLLPGVLGVDSVLVALWPYIQWAVILLFLTLAIQFIYFVGPNREQSFREQIPGALVAVVAWIGASLLLDFYLVRFTRYGEIYGVMGAVIALLTWFYVTAVALLLGAELNAEMIRRRAARGMWKLAA